MINTYMRRGAALLLALLLLMTAGAAAAVSEDSLVVWGPYRYLVQEDGTACIVYYNGVAKKLTLPETLNGLPVTAVADGFLFDDWLESVTIPNTITTLRGNPFDACPKLQEFIVADDHPTLTVIDRMLVKKDGMELLSCPRGLKLGNYTIPEEIRKIGNEAFGFCNQLSSVLIHAGVTEVGSNPFYWAENFREIHLVPDHPTLSLTGGLLIDTVSHKIVCADPATLPAELTIPDGIVEIGDYAFAENKQLQQVIIPSGVKIIGNHAFAWCDKLSDASLPEGLAVLGNNAFYCCYGLTGLNLPQGLKTIGVNALQYCTNLTGDLQIPDTVTEIGSAAFACCPGIETVSIPEGVTRLEDWLFNGCESLRALTLPEGLVYIGSDMLNQTGIMELNIPDSVTEIAESAFAYCETLERVKLPAGLKRLNDSTFAGCYLLSSVKMPEALVSIGRDAFYNCFSLNEITLADTVETIEYRAFYGCPLHSLRIPSGLVYLGDKAVSCPLIVPEGSPFEYYCAYHHLEMIRP